MAIRVRPMVRSNDSNTESCVKLLDEKNLLMLDRKFTFDHVLGEESSQVSSSIASAIFQALICLLLRLTCSQELAKVSLTAVWKATTGLSLPSTFNSLRHALDGLHSLSHSGQTGSGKTHTMIGPRDSEGNLVVNEKGVIPRAMDYVFSQLERARIKVAAILVPITLKALDILL